MSEAILDGLCGHGFPSFEEAFDEVNLPERARISEARKLLGFLIKCPFEHTEDTIVERLKPVRSVCWKPARVDVVPIAHGHKIDASVTIVAIDD